MIETTDHSDRERAMTTDRERAMTTALDYLASCTREDIDWVEILRMRAAGVSTSEIDHWVREHRSTGAADNPSAEHTPPDQETTK